MEAGKKKKSRCKRRKKGNVNVVFQSSLEREYLP
jgi:hypothetical protein